MNQQPSMEEAIINIDQNIEDAKKAIENLAAYERLTANPDFKKIISEMYLKDFAMQQVYQRNSHAVGDNAEALAANLRRIDGVGTLVAYFRNLSAYGHMQVTALAKLEMQKEQVLNGELELEYEE